MLPVVKLDVTGITNLPMSFKTNLHWIRTAWAVERETFHTLMCPVSPVVFQKEKKKGKSISVEICAIIFFCVPVICAYLEQIIKPPGGKIYAIIDFLYL